MTSSALPAVAREELREAVRLLVSASFAVRLADYADQPLNRAISVIPRLNRALHKAVNAAIFRCLEVAIDSLEEEQFPPSAWLPKAMTGLTGGIGGLFGPLALPIELPLTTTLMLRSIADIARYQGEDLTGIEGRLACLEVFALGGRQPKSKTDLGYYAVRTMFAKLSSELVTYVMERSMLDLSAPVATRLVGEVAGRFGVVVSERAAASAVPILGAVSGATLNVIFMHHFERIATAHFTLRRLERQHGNVAVSQLYDEFALQMRDGLGGASTQLTPRPH